MLSILMSRERMSRQVLLPLLFIGLGMLVPTPVFAVVHGSVSTSQGASIRDDDLAVWINSLLGPDASRLVILTECYGGNTAGSFVGGGFASTAVISATSRGQCARWGGYDIGAAASLRPGAGTTGQSVHNGGIASKDPRETPSTSGGLAPGAFSLEPITATSAVQSRHVLVYAGIPDSGNGVSDVGIRDLISSRFTGNTGTTVRTVGGSGGGGWDNPGSAAGLRTALRDIGNAIAASPNPSGEQFIMYVGDHGDLDNRQQVNRGLAVGGTALVAANFATFTRQDLDPVDLTRHSATKVPGFSIFIPFTIPTSISPAGPFFRPGEWQLVLSDPMTQTVKSRLDSISDAFYELDDTPAILGDTPGEGIQVYFQLPFTVNTTLFNDSFFDTFYDVSLVNQTDLGPHGASYFVSEFSQDTGSINKAEPVPEPATWLLLGSGLLGLVLWWKGIEKRLGVFC